MSRVSAGQGWWLVVLFESSLLADSGQVSLKAPSLLDGPRVLFQPSLLGGHLVCWVYTSLFNWGKSSLLGDLGQGRSSLLGDLVQPYLYLVVIMFFFQGHLSW